MKRLLLGLAGGLLAAGWLAASERAVPPLTVVVTGLSQEYLEPCGCGGQDAGGLARRAATIGRLRADARASVLIDLGDFGRRPLRTAVNLRALAYLGADAIGLATDDLAALNQLREAAARYALPLTSLVPPPPDQAPPARWLAIEPVAGWRVGVISIAHGGLSLPDLQRQYQAAQAELRDEQGCQATVLASHLGLPPTDWLLRRLPPEARPDLVILASDADDTRPVQYVAGVPVVPLARRGRMVIAAHFAAPGAAPRIEQRLMDRGDRHPVINAWVDDCFRAERAGERAVAVTLPAASSTEPAQCLACHAGSVAAWRQHPHAHAVETLEEIDRDVASCLRCHSQRMRADGVRPAASGDRGVTCASCHTNLAAHLLAPSEARAGSLDRAGCESCHTPENSPSWQWERYLSEVVAVCGGDQPAAAGGE